MFCGVASITRAFQDHGLEAIGADIHKDPVHNDVLTDAEFIHALACTSELHPTCGFLWQAT
eukprot:11551459-Alexandrium_andersonii.AAC.1